MAAPNTSHSFGTGTALVEYLHRNLRIRPDHSATNHTNQSILPPHPGRKTKLIATTFGINTTPSPEDVPHAHFSQTNLSRCKLVETVLCGRKPSQCGLHTADQGAATAQSERGARLRTNLPPSPYLSLRTAGDTQNAGLDLDVLACSACGLRFISSHRTVLADLLADTQRVLRVRSTSQGVRAWRGDPDIGSTLRESDQEGDLRPRESSRSS